MHMTGKLTVVSKYVCDEHGAIMALMNSFSREFL